MSIRAISGAVSFVLQNQNRETANPPVVFPGLTHDDFSFTYSIWIKVLDRTPAIIVVYRGTNGTFIELGHDGTNWYVKIRSESTIVANAPYSPMLLNRWTLISISAGSGFVRSNIAVEELGSPSDHPVPVYHPGEPAGIFDLYLDVPFSSPFDRLEILVGTTFNISCFKFFTDGVFGPLVIEQMCQSFAPITSGTARDDSPMWNTTFRTPGDISNNNYPYASRNWEHGHAFSFISDPHNLMYDPSDPAYMAAHTPCPTWVYPIGFPVVTVDPGLSPLSPTIYKGTQFWQFDDRGSIPSATAFQSIVYYGLAFGGTGGGYPNSDTWGLFIDDNGTEVPNTAITTYRFQSTTDGGIPIPNTITSNNMYRWQFGAQFGWNPTTPQTETEPAFLAYLLLYVTYIGTPTGTPLLPVENLKGLFVVNKGGHSVDEYNFGTTLEIPRPTIRTAYIGE